jgi:hypothetical protein
MTASIVVEYAPLVVHLRPAVDMTEEQFFEFLSDQPHGASWSPIGRAKC